MECHICGSINKLGFSFVNLLLVVTEIATSSLPETIQIQAVGYRQEGERIVFHKWQSSRTGQYGSY